MNVVHNNSFTLTNVSVYNYTLTNVKLQDGIFNKITLTNISILHKLHREVYI